MIESRQNPTLKRLAALRDAKGRREQGRFLIDTPRDIARALEKKIPAAAVYLCRDFPTEERLLTQLSAAKIEIVEVGPRAFEALAYRENPSGLILEAQTWDTGLARLQISAPSLVIIAEDIEKPGNLGTLLRTADAVGANAVIGCNQSVELFNPNTLRASAGAAFSVPYATATLDETLSWLREKKLRLIATSPAATQTLWQADLRAPCAIAVGSEAWGLSEALLTAAAETISLPMLGTGDSLNVSVATGVMLYEVLRQRQAK